MGCATSTTKVDDLPLVSLCRERKDLIKSAANHRFALAAAHIAYFHQLRTIGDSLCRFVEEELILANSSCSPSSPSSLSSPVLTLPSDEGKTPKKNKRAKGKTASLKGGEKESNSHLHWSSDSELSSESHHHDHDHDDGHIEIDEDDEDGIHEKVKKAPSPQPGISYIPTSPPSNYPYSLGSSYYGNPYYPPPMNSYESGISPSYYYSGSNYYPENNENLYGSSTSYTAYYMKKSSAPVPSVIYEEPKQNRIYSYSNYPPNGDNSNSEPNKGAGYFGFMMNSQRGDNGQQNQQQWRPPTPPSPKVSAWDYFNPFQNFEGGAYPGYYSQNTNGYGSSTSSPDSREVREREGIPDLEEETESEVIREVYKEKKKQEDFSFPKSKNKKVQFEDEKMSSNSNSKKKSTNTNFGEGTSKGIPMHNLRKEKSAPAPEPEPEPVEVRDVKSNSPETITSISTSPEEVPLKKKGVSFEVDSSHLDIESSKASSLTTLSAHGTRDLKEVVREIKDEFDAAADYGKEVSVLLEVDKEPYKSRSTFLKVILATVCSTPMPASDTSLGSAGGYPEGPEDGFYSRSLASTLDKLYVWEKKLYKEVKDEERLRVLYEKQCKRLKTLDDRGAEGSKVEATQASIRKLLTKINVSVRAVDSISSRIHKLRDEELQPQLKELIYGLRKMWKLMLKCHQKQFQAILESKTRALKANTGLRRDSSVRATIQLEAELLKWCHRFSNWIEMQKSYSETLNAWLQKCLHYEPEITADGEVPYSPGRIGAPPVFVICHDWKQAMERISDSEVQTAMRDFATSLHQLWERQDEEQRRRLKAENMYKDFEKQIRAIRMERQKRGHHEHDDTLSDKTSLSMVASESGISPLDDLKVDLDSMRQRVRQERAGHKEAVKLVHDAVSRSIQAGLIPIFEALENFTLEATKAFDDVRLEP